MATSTSIYPPLPYRSDSTEKEIAEGGLILSAIVGSTAHGLALTDTGDRDEMGVCIEHPSCIFGLDKFDQYIYRDALERARKAGEPVHPNPRSQPGDLDLTVYGLKKYCKLAAAGNPSLLALLYCMPIYSDEIGARLIGQRDMFVHRGAGGKFLGYLNDQRERLEGRRGQMRVTRTELIDKYGFDTKYAGHAVRLGLQGIEYVTYGTLTLPMPVHERWLCIDIRQGKYTLAETLKIIQEVEADLVYAIEKSQLPEEVDHERINNFLEQCYRDAYS